MSARGVQGAINKGTKIHEKLETDIPHNILYFFSKYIKAREVSRVN